MLPDVHLLSLLKSLWAQLAADFQAHSGNRTKTILGAIFPAGTKIDDYDFYEQSAQLLVLKPKMPGALRFGIGYVLDAQKVPALHVTLPGESMSGAPQGVGLGGAQGYRQANGDLMLDDEEAEYEPQEDDTPVTVYERSYQATYNVMAVAGSPMEAAMLYHLWKGLLLAAHPSLETAGFQNLSIGGQELRLEQEQGGTDLFSRVVSLTFFYTHHVPALLQPASVAGLKFQ